ncbi:MAG TPA: hypothetical protein VMB34_19805 [Acetobacteraceae bacterium]|nr:hypothetical protein [Acetobacteraceae bacterium]
MSASTEAGAPLAAVLACLDQLGRTLAIARNLLLGGRRVDLSGLEAEVGFICARTLDLPPEDGRVARPLLVALRSELDAIAAALSAHGSASSG